MDWPTLRDPINIAGLIRSNLIRGDVRIGQPEDLELGHDNSQLVDVQSPAEFSHRHVPSAVNLNLNTLRDTVKTLNKKRPVIYYCHVGYGGYLGYRILKQIGFDVVNLDGGCKSIVEGGFKA